MFYYIFIILQILFQITMTMKSSKELEGYPAGFLADCPGTTDYKEIPEKELKYITITVLKDRKFFNTKSAYNYYEMDQLAKLPDANFSRPTVMFLSGYMDNPNLPVGDIIGQTYKKLGYTVLLLHARSLSNTDYVRASRNTRPVGKHFAEMLANLTSHGLDPKKFSLVGISLGAHVIGFIAKNFREITGKNISRITGLDPAGPCFRNLDPEDRIDGSDADFVDIVLTNIDVFGMAAPVGHVNFYVNGGEFQPAEIMWSACAAMCSHFRVFDIWVAALENPKKFIAMKCDSVQNARFSNCYNNSNINTNVLGIECDKNNEGIFYLATSNTSPYYLGEEGLKLENEIFSKNLNLSRERELDKSKRFYDVMDKIYVLISIFL